MLIDRPHRYEVSKINFKLKEIYGTELNGKTRFRIVFSDGELEKRVGTFDEFHGKIFLRQFFGVRELPKYSYIKGRWVLEKSAWNTSKEILNHNGYEPVYVFQDKDGNYLQPIYKVAEIIIHGLFKPASKNVLEDDNEKKDAQRQQLDMDRLEDRCTDFSMLKQLGELVTVPSNYEPDKEKSNGRKDSPVQIRDYRSVSGAIPIKGEKDRSNAERV